jgi:predicted HTH transcriptional regulator
MNDFQTDMNRTVQGFVSQITELARRAAIDTLESAFGRRMAQGRPASAAASASVGQVGRPRGGRGVKRTPADLEEVSSKFVAFVKSHPGLRIEQINKELGTTTKDLALPIRKLISDGVLKAKGKKRSTTYFIGKKSKN